MNKEEPRRGLGRGLSALIGDEAAPVRGEAPKATRLHAPFGRIQDG